MTDFNGKLLTIGSLVVTTMANPQGNRGAFSSLKKGVVTGFTEKMIKISIVGSKEILKAPGAVAAYDWS